MDSRLCAALELARKAYGALEPAEPPGRWTTLACVVLGQIDATAQTSRRRQWFTGSILASPSDVAEGKDELIAVSLTRGHRSPRKAGVLRQLAQWWLTQFGDESEVGPWKGPTEQFREELVRLPGVSLELADRLLLFVGDHAVYPIDRPTVRLCCRHGWMAVEDEYEVWQSFLVGGFEGETRWLRQFCLLAARIGRAHCGRVASCDGCPLQSLLPLTGPCEPETA